MLWTRFFNGSAGRPLPQGSLLATDGNGGIYLLWASNCSDFGCRGTIDFGNGTTPAGALVKFDPNGDLLWKTALGEGAGGLAVNSNGQATLLVWGSTDPGNKSVLRMNSDGTRAWTAGSRGLSVAVGIDPDGNVLAAARGGPDDPVFGQTFASNGPVVAKLSSSKGSVLWMQKIADGARGDISGVGTSAIGTVVVAGTIGGSFDFGGQHFDTTGQGGSALLFVFEAGGQQRFARRLPDARSVVLAVDPAGRASTVGNNDSYLSVAFYNLAGDLLGGRNILVTGLDSAIVANSVAIAADHSTVLGGVFTGTADFGAGPVRSRAHDGFIANLGQ